MNINQIIDNAKALGIKLTNADLDTEICKCWADRVQLAAKMFKDGRYEDCQDMIDDANSYAI